MFLIVHHFVILGALLFGKEENDFLSREKDLKCNGTETCVKCQNIIVPFLLVFPTTVPVLPTEHSPK